MDCKMKTSEGIGIVFSQWLSEAKPLAERLMDKLQDGYEPWVCSLDEFELHPSYAQKLSLIITVGGDGTILRVVRIAAVCGVPIVGVNLGRVGFMTELSPKQAIDGIRKYVQSSGWIEERTMLVAQVFPEETRHDEDYSPCHGLNEAVLGRPSVARLIHVEIRVNDQKLASSAADSIIVSTATGSTGYNLSAGGPILYPESPSLLLKPVSPQLSLDSAIILNPDAEVSLRLLKGHPALLSVDGHVDLPLSPGDTVKIKRSPYVAKFMRIGNPGQLPQALAQRLSSPSREETY
jgi:NAD+ kinase